MRLLPCLAALVLATTTVTTQIASACGGYEQFQRQPSVMLVSSHTGHGLDDAGKPTSRTRSFALLAPAGEITDHRLWEMVAPRSYDSTRVRALGKMPARTLTLIGPNGSRVVSTSSHVEIEGPFFKRGSVFDAVELPQRQGDNFTLAIEGTVPDATWHPITGSYSYTSKISGTSIAVTSRYTDGESRVTLRSGKRNLGTYRGYVLGALDMNGSRYVVLNVDDFATTVEVPMT